MKQSMTRRRFVGRGTSVLTGVAAASGTVPGHHAYAAEQTTTGGGGRTEPFRIGLNTSTLRGHKLPIEKVIDIAGAVGYRAIEPWPDELARYVEAGKSLKDLDRRLKDHGLLVSGAIAFFEWMVDDKARRDKAIEEAKQQMDRLARIGATHIAAPPRGDVKNVDLLVAAQRYHDLLEAARPTGVIPAIEVWGHAPKLNRLGQAVLVALEAHHPDACILPDVFHLYKGGSGLSGVRHLNGNLLAGFHLNDYPADPPREKARDADRVYPGDGVAPLAQLLRDLRAIHYRGVLSVELFNPSYYKQDPTLVARTALEKTQAVIRKALG